ncbi:mucin-2-like [Liolophura sinensis]|uniref:mucin-2-like n=1 Tax=Liolophura sinensis TaxID=3198878 RepID=UPI003158C310
MSQVLLTAKDAQDNINNNNVADLSPLSRAEFDLKSGSCREHGDSKTGEIPLRNAGSNLVKAMGVTNFDSSKSMLWRSVAPVSQPTTPSSQNDNNSRGRVAKIEEGLDNSVGPEAKVRINKILGDVNRLSDVEKLLLYLKLPTGSGSSEDALKQLSNSSLHTSNRVQQGQAFTWIKSHLEEDQEKCLAKQEVFEDYRLYCENHGLKCLSTADFGKVMKCVFPNIKPRRLGQRGQSKYCYSGLRKRQEVHPPGLPELEISSTQTEEERVPTDELFTASCHLICEWAQKLLGKSFSDLRELAEYLLGNLYVNSKSMSAFTVIAAMRESGGHTAKGNMSQLFSNPAGGNKHRETQLQLQRKLQERELLKEQKKKLQQQKTEIEREQAQSRAGSSSERELGTPSLIHGRSSERDLETPSVSLGRSSTTPCDDIASPARSSLSCSPSRTPTRGDSVECRRTASETEFVSPVAIRDTYRRRNSQGSSDKERRKREKMTPQLSSPLFEAARNLLEGPKNLDRQLFFSESEYVGKAVEKDILVNKPRWDRTKDDGKHFLEDSSKRASFSGQEHMDTCSSAATVASSSSYSKHLLNIAPAKCNAVFEANLSPDSNSDHNPDKRLSQASLAVPIAPSRSAFVPFPQRILGTHSQPPSSSTALPLSQSIISPISSAASVLPTHLQKSRGLARLLMSKPKKDVGIVEKHSDGDVVDVINSCKTPGSSSNTSNQNLSISIQSPDIQVQPSQSGLGATQPAAVSHQDVLGSIQPMVRSSPVAPISIQHVLKPYQDNVSSHHDTPIPIQPAIPSSPITIEVNNNHRQDQPQTPSSSPGVENSTGAVSPLTPRRTKTRFTPIRPKAPAPRTVSSMLREHRGPPVSVEGVGFGSKPVSEILKEKRERETLLLPLSPAAGSLTPCLSGVQLSPNLAISAQVPVVQPVLARTTDVQGPQPLSARSKTREVFIIMGASPSASASHTNSPVSAKTRRSNTISIPIIQKDIGVRLNPSHTSATSVPHDTQHSHSISDSHLSEEQHRSQSIHEVRESHNTGGVRKVCSMETEDSASVAEILTSKRKRKSPGSAKDLFNVQGAEVHNGMKPLQTDVVATSVDSSDSQSDCADENNPKRSKSCLPSLENCDSAVSSSSEERFCPDITSLESDALVDMPLSAAELATSLGSDTLSFENLNNQATMKTASVGVTSHSMKLSHKLMRQSLQLDKRIDTFLKQRSSKPQNINHQVASETKSTGCPVTDKDVMSSHYYSNGNKHRSSNRTASDTKLSVKPCANHEKTRSTVHRGVVQTSNSFVVKKPLASKGSSRDHFLLKLLTGDSKSTPQPTLSARDLSVSHTVPVQQKPQAKLGTLLEPKSLTQNNTDFLQLDDLASVFSKADSQDMDVSVDSELPTDVADFITEAMEKRLSAGYIPSQKSSFVNLQMEEFHQQGEGLQNLGEAFPTSFQRSRDMSAEILSSQVPASHQHSCQDGLFTVPSIPPSGRDLRQRKNTPVQRSISVPMVPMTSAGHSMTMSSSVGISAENHDKMVEPVESLVSASMSHTVLHRMNSAERAGTQTPISDAGYHSFDSSPVPSTTPLPICLAQPQSSELNTRGVGLESNNQISGSSQPQSPVELPSPKTHRHSSRSTPLSQASPHIISLSSAETSPVGETSSTHNAFMPIGGSGSMVTEVESCLVNPVKPTVTLAANGVFSSHIYSPKTPDTSTSSVHSHPSLPVKNTEGVSRKSSQTSPLCSPPSYQDAIQSLQCQTPTSLTQEDSKLSHGAATDVPRDVTQELVELKADDAATGADQLLVFKPDISPAVFPFSYQLSLLRSKSSELDNAPDEDGNEMKLAESNLSSPMSGSTCSEYSALGLPGSAETEQVEFQNVATLIKHYHANSLQQVQTRKPSVLLPEDILVQLQEHSQKAANSTSGSTGRSAKSKQHFDLPDARYMGSTPNVDVRNLLSDRQVIGRWKPKPKTVEDCPQVNPGNTAVNIRSLLEVKLVCSGNSQQKGSVEEDGVLLARRNLSQILGGTALSEDDLQTTLEDLKSLDTQYFNNIPVHSGSSEQAIPEDIRDLRPLDLNNTDIGLVENQED